MRCLPFLIVIALLLVPVPSQAQNDPAPYLYYYSRVLNGFVIESADGTDSRIIGQGLVPADHNWINGPGWSPSGEWFAWTSSRIDPAYHGVYESKGYVIRADGSGVREFAPGGLISEFKDTVILNWSLVADVLFVIEDFRQNMWQGEPVRASLIDMQTGTTIASIDTPIPTSLHGPSIIGWSPNGQHASFSYVFMDPDHEIYEHRLVTLSMNGQTREDMITTVALEWLPTLGWSPDGQAVVSYFDDYQGQYQIVALFPDGRRIERQVADGSSYTMGWKPYESLTWGPEGWLGALSLDRTSLILDRITTGEPVVIPLPAGITDMEFNWHPTQPIALEAGIHEDESAELWLLADQTLELVDDSVASVGYCLPLESCERVFFFYWAGLWSPDGQHAVYRSGETTLALFDLKTATSHELPNQTEWGQLNAEGPVRWSPDSALLNLFASKHGVGITGFFYNIASQTLTSPYATGYYYGLFTPDGQDIILNLNSTGITDRTKMTLTIATQDQTLLPVHSGAISGYDTFRWDSQQEWAIDGAVEACIGACSPWLHMAVIRRDGTGWREIGTNNFSSAILGWVPERVDLNQLPPGQSDSLTISPVAFDYEQTAWFSNFPSNLLVVCDADGNASVRHLDSAETVLTFSKPMPCGENFETRGTLNPDKTVLALSWTGLQLWRISDGQRIGWVDTLALNIRFSEDGRWLYTRELEAELTWDLAQVIGD